MEKITRIILCIFIFTLSTVFANAAENQAPKYMWYRDVPQEDKDYYVAFRGQLNLSNEGDYEIQLLGASWFVGWLDGKYFCEGPARFPAEYPEYQTFHTHLTAGLHTISFQVHQIGEATRILDNPEPFLYVFVKKGDREIPVGWKCKRLDGYESQVKRINPELGFIEWCDTRKLPIEWQKPGFDDTKWTLPVQVLRKLGALKPLSENNVRSTVQELKPISSGCFIDRFGYEKDNPAARFFLRNLAPINTVALGEWRRYDLGRVRLMRPKFTLDLPEGSVVEFAYSEDLVDGRVNPWITLSAGESCNMDHYVARGGEQEFFPLTPRGGRYLEVHIYAPVGKIRFIKEEILERTYFGEPDGAFKASDTLLNKIWSVGVETLRSCSEDALIDNPTRERGQWTGDVVSVGMDVTAAAYSDMQLLKRGLVQSAQCARSDGLVAGLSPGGTAYLSTYAAQWISACVHYWELTGDLKFLNDLYPSAARNIKAFEKQKTIEGLSSALGWGFVDWGYVPNSGKSDMAVNLHYLTALNDMERWCNAIGKKNYGNYYKLLADTMAVIVNKYYTAEFQIGGEVWKRIGYHRAVLGLRQGFFSGKHEKECIAFIKEHMLQCFPNDVNAPRLSDPGANNPQLITPYFAYYAMPVLIEHGEMNFVLDQYRKCWGWMLQDARTTWLEVFDTRWSHCHQWAGSPTWQMSRYLLGLQPRYDLGNRHFILKLNTGNLQNVSGTIPLREGEGEIKIEWLRKDDGVHFHLKTPVPIYLHLDEKHSEQKSKIIHIENEFDMVFDDR